jgi:HAD superfamily hydrolase (TIGR01509 family)
VNSDSVAPNIWLQRTCRKVTHSAREEQNARLFATPLIWALGGTDTLMQGFDAVIFDCDGVLVNSEELAQAVEVVHLAAIGLRYDQQAYARRFAGTTMADFRDLLRADYSERFGAQIPALFFDEMAQAVRASYEVGLAPLEGAIEFVAAVKTPKAVASGSTLELVRMKLKRVGLAAEFGSHIYTSEATRSKPHPDVFLQAAAGIQAAPERVAVIEDSCNGIIGAKRAGMFAIGYTGGGHCLDEHERALYDVGADIVFGTYQDMSEHFLSVS